MPRTETTVKILALDVSATACGWAVLDATWPPRLRDFGLHKPPAGWAPIDRMRAMARTIDAAWQGLLIDRVVIEFAEGKVTRPVGHRPDGRPILPTGLAVMGQAQGYLVGRLESLGYEVETVPENTWTQGKPKKSRAKQVAREFPAYAQAVAKNPRYDPGLDVADAIGLGVWWLEQERLRLLSANGGLSHA